MNTENLKRHLENMVGGLIFLFQLFSSTSLLFPWYYCVDDLSLLMKDVINNILTIIFGIWIKKNGIE